MPPFFQPPKQNEHNIYSRLRDNPRASDLKQNIEALWSQYEPYAPTGFLSKAQYEFHQCWWEMYLAVGLINLGFPITVSPPSRQGPDIAIRPENAQPFWIEAVAPKVGTTSERVPAINNGVNELPKNQCLLRLSQGLDAKRKKFEEYKHIDLIRERDFCIIALSSCDLNQFGTLLDFPIPAPMSVLCGSDCLVITGTNSPSFINRRGYLYRNSGNLVDTNFFTNESSNIISAILYSNVDPLNFPIRPETTFQLFINPNTINPLPEGFKNYFETWTCTRREQSEEIWERHNGENPDSL